MVPCRCTRCGYVARTSDEVDAHEAAHFAYSVTFESFECADERRTLERAADAHMLSVIRRDAAPSFMTGGRP